MVINIDSIIIRHLNPIKIIVTNNTLDLSKYIYVDGDYNS